MTATARTARTLVTSPSYRRFDVLGGPGGYLSARYVGALRADEYVATWEKLVRVNVPRRLRVSPRATYGAVRRRAVIPRSPARGSVTPPYASTPPESVHSVDAGRRSPPTTPARARARLGAT